MQKHTSSIKPHRLTLSNSGCKVNEISASELLNYYYQSRFIYEAKLKRIEPYLPIILQNWDRAMSRGEEIARVVTYTPESSFFASAMMWRYTDNTWVGQHLVSTGHRISQIPMLAIHGSMIQDAAQFSINHISCWYRPDNRLPRLFFEGSRKDLGLESTSVTRWNYFECNVINPNPSNAFRISDCTPSDYPAFEFFMKATMDQIWYASQEFHKEDLEMNKLNNEYQKVGLERSRKIILAFKQRESLPSAVAICYKGPLGLNLSFLENKVLLIFKRGINDVVKQELIKSLLPQVIRFYKTFPLNFIPLLVQDDDKTAVERGFGFPLFRKYNQSIWCAPQFQNWYDYVHKLTTQYGAANPVPVQINTQNSVMV